MILAQNHPQPLNGNKISTLIILLLFIFTSCGTQKKVVNNNNRSSTKKSTKKSASKNVKTRKWTVVDQKKTPPIGAEKVIVNEKKSSYHIALLIPFNTKNSNSKNLIQSGSPENRFMNFYTGMKMALESSNSANNISVSVHDCGSKNIESVLTKSDVKKADVIIGPYQKSNIKEAAFFAEKNEITLISPWQASKKIANKNAYYVQMKPNLEDHYTNIAEDILKKYSPDQVYLVGRSKASDKARFKYFQSVSKNLKGKEFNTYIVNEDSLKYGETAYDSSFFMPDKPAVFVIPNWKSEDENFIYSCMRKLRVEKRDAKVIVYGMPIVADSDKITYDLYANLNTHVALTSFYDKENREVKNFRRRYYNIYNSLPTSDAAQGYDLANYVCNNLSKNGKNFQFFLDRDTRKYLISKYNVERYLVDIEDDKNDPKNINYFLNNKVQIIHFTNGSFRLKP